LNNYSNKSYLSIQILAKGRFLLSKLKALCDIRKIKCTFSKEYNQHGIKPVTYVDDINLSVEFIQAIRKIKLFDTFRIINIHIGMKLMQIIRLLWMNPLIISNPSQT
jgi:hypothetical protein